MNALRETLERLTGQVLASDTGQRLLVWWNAQSPRDQRALQLLGGFAGIVLLLVLVLYPPLREAAEARERLSANQELLAWMQRNEPLARRAADTLPVSRTQSLQELITATAADRGLNLRRLEPVGDDGFKIYMDRVPFDPLLTWLDALSRESVRIDDLRLQRDSAPGRVTVNVTLRG
jgi:type II secretory pathway component PulM